MGIQTKREKLTKIVIIEQTWARGDLVNPGKPLTVPGQIPEHDALTLVGLGKAVPASEKKEVQDRIAKAKKDFATAEKARMERKEKLKGVSTSELLAAVVGLTEQVAANTAAAQGAK